MVIECLYFSKSLLNNQTNVCSCTICIIVIPDNGHDKDKKITI